MASLEGSINLNLSYLEAVVQPALLKQYGAVYQYQVMTVKARAVYTDT